MNKCYYCLLLSAGLLSDDQQLAAVNEVVARLESRSHSLKMAALKLLEQLGKKEWCQPTCICLTYTCICLTHISTDNVVCRCGGKRSDPGNTPTVDRPQCKFTSYQLFKNTLCDIGPTQLSTKSEEKLSRVLDTGRQYSYIPHPSLQLQIRCAAFSAVKRLTGVVNRFATNKSSALHVVTEQCLVSDTSCTSFSLRWGYFRM